MTGAPASSPQSRYIRRRGRILVGLMLAVGLVALESTIVATAVPTIVHDLGGFSLFPWVFSAYLLPMAVTAPVYGKLSDIYGRRPMILFGTVLFLVGALLCGFAWSMPALIAARAVQGIGAGGLHGVSQTVVADMYDLKERGRVSGWMSSVWGMSAIVGPAVGGVLSQYGGWRWIFYLNVPIGLAALAMVLIYFKESVTPTRRRIDVEGGLLLMLWTGLLVLGLLAGGVQWEWRSWQTPAVFAGGAVLLVVFAWWERRAAEPMLPPWVFGTRSIAGPNLAQVCVGLTVSGLTTFLPMFAQSVLSATPVEAGFVLAAMSIGWPLASSQAYRLYLRIGFRDTCLIGVGLMLVASGLFVAGGGGASIWYLGLASLVTGGGLGLLSNSSMVGVQSSVEWKRRGVATGSLIFTRTIGTALGAAVFGGIANASLSAWLRDAPRGMHGLPANVDDAARLAAAGGGSPVVEFVREGLAVSVQRVLWGVGVVAVLALVVVLFTPRRTRLAGED